MTQDLTDFHRIVFTTERTENTEMARPEGCFFCANRFLPILTELFRERIFVSNQMNPI